MIKNIIPTEEGFTTTYDHTCIERTVAEYDKSVRVYYTDGSEKEVHVVVDSFHAQYGLSVSEDGQYLLVPDWDKGRLFCYNIDKDTLAWKLPVKKICGMVVYEDNVVCLSSGKCLTVVSIEHGKAIKEEKLSAESLFALNTELFMVGPVRNNWQIRKMENLDIVQTISEKEVNPNDCFSFLLNSAALDGQELVIEGFEQDEDDALLGKPMTPYSRRITLK